MNGMERTASEMRHEMIMLVRKSEDDVVHTRIRLA